MQASSSPRVSTFRSLTIWTFWPMRQFLSRIAPSMRLPLPMPMGGAAGGAVGFELGVPLVDVGPHRDRVSNGDVLANDGPQADDAVFNHRPAANFAAVGDETPLDGRSPQ